MNSLEITLKLPEDLAQDAREFGILDSATLISLIQAEVDRKVNDLVNEEIHAYRIENKSTDEKAQ